MSAMDWMALAACKDEDPALFFPPDPDEDDLSWMDLARCTEVDSEIFFPEKGGSTRDAKKVCAGCEVRDECLEYALEHHDVGRFGVWGGTSEPERRLIHAERGRLPLANDPDSEKMCTGCRQPKPLTQFSVDRTTPDGRKQRCKICTRRTPLQQERRAAA